MNKVYVDTSVVGGCFDEGIMEDSNAFFEEARKGTISLVESKLVVDELEDARQEVKNVLESVLLDPPDSAFTESDVQKLAREYIDRGALTNKSFDDALHIALATLSEADVLVSWNFKHIVHADKIKIYNAVNKELGYKTIEIMSPTKFLNTLYESN